MIDDAKFSIVIPVYKNQDTIEHTLDSAFSQDYKNFEVIISNDGSGIDYSYLLEKYPELIIYNNCKNGGPGIARQRAIDYAVTGDWVLFLDADDVLYDNSVLSTLTKYTRLHSRKINVLTGIYFVYKQNIPKPTVYDSMFGPLHAKCFRVSFLKENNIRFREDMFYFEDLYFNILFSLIDKTRYRGKSIVKVNKVLYKQIERDNSITTSEYEGDNPYFIAGFKTLEKIYTLMYESNDIGLTDDDKKMLIIVLILIMCNYIGGKRFNPPIDLSNLSMEAEDVLRRMTVHIKKLYEYEDDIITNFDSVFNVYNPFFPEFYKQMIVLLYSYTHKDPVTVKNILEKCINEYM